MYTEEENLIRTIDNLQSHAIQILQSLVRISSITGNETKAQTFFAELLRNLDLDVDCWYPTREELQNHPAFSDDGLPLEDRPVIVGHLHGTNSSAQSLILNGHMDVVPVGDENAWIDGPWSGVVRDGNLYGRGSCDMKGGLVAGLIAITAFRNAAIVPEGSAWIQSVIGEESGGVGTLSAVQRGYRADAAVVLEPTKMAICPVGAGAASFRLHVKGRSAHGAMRQDGISAIEKFQLLFSSIQELERSRHVNFNHPLYKEGRLISPISIGKVQAGDWPSTVPESLVAEGRFGIFPGEDISAARSEFEAAIHSASQKDDWLRQHSPKVEWFEGQFEAAETDLNSPIIAELQQSHTIIHRSQPDVYGVPYGSDLRFFTNNAHMQAVLYGPGDVRMAHSANEFVPIDEVLSVAKVLALTILHWCK